MHPNKIEGITNKQIMKLIILTFDFIIFYFLFLSKINVVHCLFPVFILSFKKP